MLNAGTAFNVVPGRGALFCDLRADDDAAILGVLDAVPREVGGVPAGAGAHAPVAGDGRGGGDRRAARRRRRPRSGGRSSASRRGGASDASHIAKAIPLTVDGLGPRGGKAHNPGEYVLGRVAAQPGRGALAMAAPRSRCALAAGSAAERERLELARAQQRQQLAARAARRAPPRRRPS